MAANADDHCKQAAYDALREGAWTAAATSLTDEAIHAFVDACLAQARTAAA